jgi:hypothetical protein
MAERKVSLYNFTAESIYELFFMGKIVEEGIKQMKIEKEFICPNNVLRIEVKDKSNDEPLENARVLLTLRDGSFTSVEYTNDHGIALFELTKNGTYDIEIRKSGYSTFETSISIRLCEIEKPKEQPKEEKEQIIVEKPIIQEAKRLVINAPDTAYIGDKIKIFVRYENGEIAKNVEIKVVKGNNIITLTTDENGEASFVPLEEGIYIYTSSIPLSKSTLTTVMKKEQKIFKAEVPLSIKETSTVYITPKTEGEYKVEVYLGDKLITTTKGKGTAMITLPEGNYKVTIISEREIKGVQIEIPFKEKAVTMEITDLLPFFLLLLLLLLLWLMARFYLKWRQEKARKTLEETAREIKQEETKLEGQK